VMTLYNLNSMTGLRAYSFGHMVIRLLWNATWLLAASWTPKYFARWRRFLLRLFGAQMAPFSDVRGTARVWYPPLLTMESHTVLSAQVNCYNMERVTIKSNTIVSRLAFICAGTHDYTKASHPLVARPIVIGPNVWVCAEAFVGPGSHVPEGCVVGARSVVTGQLQPWSVYAGNPCRRIKAREYDPAS